MKKEIFVSSAVLDFNTAVVKLFETNQLLFNALSKKENGWKKQFKHPPNVALYISDKDGNPVFNIDTKVRDCYVFLFIDKYEIRGHSEIRDNNMTYTIPFSDKVTQKISEELEGIIFYKHPFTISVCFTQVGQLRMIPASDSKISFVFDPKESTTKLLHEEIAHEHHFVKMEYIEKLVEYSCIIILRKAKQEIDAFRQW